MDVPATPVKPKTAIKPINREYQGPSAALSFPHFTSQTGNAGSEEWVAVQVTVGGGSVRG